MRHFEQMIDKWARLLNIQRRQSIKPSGREYHLITLMGPGERHHDPQYNLIDLTCFYIKWFRKLQQWFYNIVIINIFMIAQTKHGSIKGFSCQLYYPAE
jgi:hypothetical protein